MYSRFCINVLPGIILSQISQQEAQLSLTTRFTFLR